MNKKKRLLLITAAISIIFAMLFCCCGVDSSNAAGIVNPSGGSEDIPDEYYEDYDEEYDGSEGDEDFAIVDDAEDEISDDIQSEELQTQEEAVSTYVLNTNTKKFHYPSCRSVSQMKDKNKLIEETTRDDLISRGFDPCGNCHP